MPTICRYEFPETVDPESIHEQIAVAILVAECVFGKPKVRISAGYLVGKTEPRAVIDISTEVGEFVAVVFTGMMIKELGDLGFKVERVED